MPRRLLNIASIVCLVLCVALMGMWVRSCSFCDLLNGSFCTTQGFIIDSEQSRLSLAWVTFSPRIPRYEWRYNAVPLHDYLELLEEMREKINVPPQKEWPEPKPFGFGARMRPDEWMACVPYWFLVATTGSLAMIFRLRWPLRFTLRSLFIATTFLAVVLGMIAWLDRAWIGK